MYGIVSGIRACLRAYVRMHARMYVLSTNVCMYYVCIPYIYIYIYIYICAYTDRIACQQSVIKIFLYGRLRSAYIILRNNGTGVPAH